MKSKNKSIKTIFLTISTVFMLSMPLTAAAESCTDWSTYYTSYGNCSTAWCNPVWKPAGLKQNVTYYQSRSCHVSGTKYETEYRRLDSTQCNC